MRAARVMWLAMLVLLSYWETVSETGVLGTLHTLVKLVTSVFYSRIGSGRDYLFFRIVK